MIKIRSKPALIGIKTQPAKLNMRKLQMFSVKNTPPKMVVKFGLPTSSNTINKIDKQAQSEIGAVLELSEAYLEKSENVNGEIAIIGADGKMISDVDNKALSIDKISSQNNPKDILTSPPPIELPTTQVNEGKLIVDWLQGEFEINWDKSTSPEVLYEPSSIEFFMLQYPELKIDFVENDNIKINKNTKNKGSFIDKFI